MQFVCDLLFLPGQFPDFLFFRRLIRSERLQFKRQFIKPALVLLNFVIFPLFALLEILQVFVEGRNHIVELGQILHYINVADFMFFQTGVDFPVIFQQPLNFLLPGVQLILKLGHPVHSFLRLFMQIIHFDRQR